MQHGEEAGVRQLFNESASVCTVLYCTVLYCTILYCVLSTVNTGIHWDTPGKLSAAAQLCGRDRFRG